MKSLGDWRLTDGSDFDKKGSHIQFRHPTKKGRVTVPHPKRDMTIRTIKSRLSGLCDGRGDFRRS
jgi:HicA toxin of bacterial toxin-antitoxin,